MLVNILEDTRVEPNRKRDVESEDKPKRKLVRYEKECLFYWFWNSQVTIKKSNNHPVKQQQNTIQSNPKQHNTTQQNIIQLNPKQRNTPQHKTTQNNTTQHNIIQPNPKQHNTTQNNTI